MQDSKFSRKDRSIIPILVATLLSCSFLTEGFGQGLQINEFLAANKDGILDGDGDGSDWIELFNAGASALDLSGYSLTDDVAEPGKWMFPVGTTLGPGGYLLVFASGKDRAVAGEELHASFRLGVSEGYLGLFDAAGTAVDSFNDLPEQREDVSYGLGVSDATIPQNYVVDEAACKWLVPAADIGSDWQQPTFNDADWEAATLGLGYDYDDITGENGNLKSAMQGVNASVFVRVPFEVENPARVVAMSFAMRYEDGFAAYLNGHLIASGNSPDSLAWNSEATSSHSDSQAIIPVEFELSSADFAGRLVAGTNILSIQGMNSSRGGSDALVYPSLTGAISAEVAAAPGYFQNPTPGVANSAKVGGFVLDTVTEPKRGFYEQAIEVTLTNPSEGATLYYTLDETEPTPEEGIRYTGPITIDKTTVLRAAAHQSGHVPSPIDTNTYLFIDDVIQQSGMHTSVTEDPELGPQMRDALTALPTISIVTTEDRELKTGSSTGGVPSVFQPEVTCSAEWLNPDGTEGFQIDCGVARFGGFFTNFPKKSLRLYFRKAYGESTLQYPVFDGFEYEVPPVDEFDSLSLRSGSHDARERGAYMSNRFADDTLLDMGQIAPHGRFIHVYLNGEYWGQYHLRERWHAAMFARYFGGEKEDYVAINGDNSGSEFLPGLAYNGSARWYDLRFESVSSVNDLTSDGNALVIVALVANELHVRIFNSEGREVKDLRESRLVEGAELESLKQLLKSSPFPDASQLAEAQKERIIDLAASIADYDAQDLWDEASDRAGEDYEMARTHVDIEDYVSFMIMWGSGNSESEFRAAGGLSSGIPPETALEVPFKFFLKDADGYLRGHQTSRARHNGPMRLFRELNRDKDPEYITMAGDLIHKYFFNEGAMTTEKLVNRLQKRVDEVKVSFIAESARWSRTFGRTHSNWTREMNTYLTRNLPRVEAGMLKAYQSAGLYPDVAAPVFSQHGGTIPADGSVKVAADSIIFYTTDGSDPRLVGGESNPSAVRIDGRGIPSQFFDLGATWKYLDDGSEQGTAWRARDFNDGTWAEGPAELGYGDGDEATVVGFGPSASNKFVTTYFRRTFDAANVESLREVTVTIKRDDGAAIYINGTEVVRDLLPEGEITSTTFASSRGDEDELSSFSIDPSVLVNGANVIAVEIHQQTAGNSDISFDCKLDGIYVQGTPSVGLSGPATVKARAFDESTSMWSALNQAFFSPPAAIPTSENLVISEIMYNPGAPTEGEITEGFTNADRFEFVELTNISNETLNMANVAFVDGIGVKISEGVDSFLPAGGRFLLVKDAEAFALRYGMALPVIGTFTGNLRNSGEKLELQGPAGTIRSFEFDDSDPWPSDADGAGASLELISPNSNPDHALVSNWRASVPGGTPGQGDGGAGEGYAAWRATVFTAAELADAAISGDAADSDADGLPVFMEFAVGGSPTSADFNLGLGITNEGGDTRLTYARSRGASGVAFEIEQSDTLTGWQNADAAFTAIETLPLSATSERVVLRYNGGVNAEGYFRLRIQSGQQ